MKRAYANRDAIAGLDPANYLRTYQLTILYDFPKDARIGLNLAFYPILCILLAARVLLFRPDLTADLKTLHRSWLFLTFVVGTNTFGMQLIIFQRCK